jgi:hypothetical protein
MPRVAPVVPDEADLLCEGCGYTLNGLPTSGNCPECGKPIEQSIGEHRVLPAWESDGHTLRAFLQTSRQVMFHPTQFYRTLATRRDTRPAATFASYHWRACSLLFAVAAILHLKSFTGLMRLPLRIGTLHLLVPYVIAFPFAIYFTLLGTTRLAAILTHWEASYRGIRLPRSVVLRGMYYHAAHYLPVAALAMVTVVGFHLLIGNHLVGPSWIVYYLYVLSGEVILCAFYLFETYWIGMRNMMYANR